jgi:hypothetical protein
VVEDSGQRFEAVVFPGEIEFWVSAGAPRSENSCAKARVDWDFCALERRRRITRRRCRRERARKQTFSRRGLALRWILDTQGERPTNALRLTEFVYQIVCTKFDMTQRGTDRGSWPDLPYPAWRETCATLHLWTQIVGKIRLSQTP